MSTLFSPIAEVCTVFGMAVSHIYQTCTIYRNHTW